MQILCKAIYETEDNNLLISDREGTLEVSVSDKRGVALAVRNIGPHQAAPIVDKEIWGTPINGIKFEEDRVTLRNDTYALPLSVEQRELLNTQIQNFAKLGALIG